MTDSAPLEDRLAGLARWDDARAFKGEARSFVPQADRPEAVDDEAFRERLVADIPTLRAFTRGLCGEVAAGDDLAQDTLLKAWRYRAQFRPGTNFKGWILTIARNHFYSQRRRVWRETPLDEAMAANIPANGSDPLQVLLLNDLRSALGALTEEQRAATLLVGAGGLPHRLAAEMCGVPEGTMKSRVCRARAKLVEVLEHGEVTPDAAPASMAAQLIMAELSVLSEAHG